MELIKCGKKGQITIPRDIIKKLGLGENTPMLVELSDDGAIILRQAAVVPLEVYSDERIAAFEREGQLTPTELERARALTGKTVW
jgi:AbrB family looped-hinge helix DNA binding protein